MSKKDEEIQRKLQELEAAVLKESITLKETNHPLVAPEKSASLLTVEKNQVQSTVQNDLCYFAGIGLILTSLFLFFNHIRVGTGMLQMVRFGWHRLRIAFDTIDGRHRLVDLRFKKQSRLALERGVVCGDLLFSAEQPGYVISVFDSVGHYYDALPAGSWRWTASQGNGWTKGYRR